MSDTICDTTHLIEAAKAVADEINARFGAFEAYPDTLATNLSGEPRVTITADALTRLIG